jgi:hypothetical protein
MWAATVFGVTCDCDWVLPSNFTLAISRRGIVCVDDATNVLLWNIPYLLLQNVQVVGRSTVEVRAVRCVCVACDHAHA